MRDLTRRTALAGLSAAGGVALAGCLSDGGNDSPDDEDDPNNDSGDNGLANGDDNGTPAADLELVDTSLESSEAAPGGSDWVEATVAGSTVTFTGVTPAPNPCQRAVLADVTLNGGDLSLAIGVEPDTSAGEACPTLIGEVAYTATCEFSAAVDSIDAFESVTVDHRYDLGSTHTIVADGTIVEEFTGQPSSQDPAAPGEFPMISEYSMTTLGCESDTTADIGRGEAETTIADGAVTLDGDVVVPTPCHEAVLDSVTIDGDTLSVTVGARSTLDDEFCVQQLCRLTYEATLTLADGVDVSEVTVSHELLDES